jgi:C4-dicarboxylate-specific signal transduction histidine kinase
VDTVNKLIGRLRRSSADGAEQRGGHAHHDLAARVAALEAAVEENRRLNQRLADVVDVVTELLVPALDRDDARVAEALANLNKTLTEPDTTAG